MTPVTDSAAAPRVSSAQAAEDILAVFGTRLFAVCLLACVVPTRRALAVEPTEALRAEG